MSEMTWRNFRPLPADIEARLEQLPAVLAEAGVLLAYLFGSLAQGRPGNDVDLALLTPPENPPYRLRDIITGCLDTERVDIVDLRRASPVLKFTVISDGRCLYAAHDDIRHNFIMATLRQYQDTNYLRETQNKILRERMRQWSSAAKASLND
jgi:uncharacterized protein